MKKRLNKTEKENRKWHIIKLIGGILFLLSGAVFGLITLYLNHWDFVQFITNPTTDLVLLILVAVGVFFLSSREIK